MAFDALSEKLQNIFKKLNGKGRITEKDVNEAMKEVKMALFDADVNFKIVKDFIKTVTEKAVGGDVLESVTPGQQVIKIVSDELTSLLGSSQSQLTFSSKPPTVYMMVGLNGAGKTSTSGKLAVILRKQGRSPLLAACDVYRPAAIKQLQVLCSNYNLPVFEMGDKASPVEIAKKAIERASANRNDVVILDTAGRFHINEELMEELRLMKKAIHPQEILLIVDAMTGQDAVNVAKTFNEQLGIDGIIMTKLDSDTRGGAALSARTITGKPIKYVAVGEKVEDLEAFYPDRMASRILGMGDVVTLVEKAHEAYDMNQALELERKMRSNDFTLEDFLAQTKQVKKMGPLKNILGMIPGMGGKLDDVDVDEHAFDMVEAIICSMTPAERRNANIINGSRKRRIAKGSGTSVQDINRLLKQFEETKKMFREFSGIAKGKKGGGGRFPKIFN
ncbi:MAG: signal recognition particle protein [Clostridiales bacterium]|jgi:signal recognition particle subunit SRP54|nr:signal recognition particle protein [Clostridiales bacterium]